MALTEIPIELSSTPSIVDNGNATAITIDSSENATFAGPIQLTAGALAAAGNASLSHRSSDNKVYLQAGTGGFNILDDQQNTHFAIDSAGVSTFNNNVGIGVVPETWQSTIDALQVGLGASFAGNTVNPSRVYLSANYYINSSNQESYIATDEASQYFQNAGTHIFKVAPSGTADSAISWNTAATIDNSGNLLVGQASTTFPGVGNTTAGVSIRGQDGSFFSRILGSGDTNNVVSVNRSTADGNILGFQKDGTTVGSIGTNSGYMVIGSPVGTDAHLLIGNGLIHPATSTGGGKDASIDIGGSSNRFKDIYLSGGVNFSANANAAGASSELLDDYEEGTWTPTLIGCDAVTFSGAGLYVKIGALVHVQWYSSAFTVSNAVGGNARIGGLPFAGKSGKYGSASFAHTTAFTNSAAQGFTNSTATEVYVSFEGGTSGNTWSQGFPKYVMMSCIYFTDS